MFAKLPPIVATKHKQYFVSSSTQYKVITKLRCTCKLQYKTGMRYLCHSKNRTRAMLLSDIEQFIVKSFHDKLVQRICCALAKFRQGLKDINL